MQTITLPGLIDPHVHLRTPGQEQKEDFFTGTSAALAGGYTTIVDMPNNVVPITTQKLLEEKMAIARQQTVCNIGFHFGSLGTNLDEFPKVQNHVIGLKLFLNVTTGNFLIDTKTLEKIFTAWSGGVILLHAEGDKVAEAIQVIEKTRKPTHFCHISTKADLLQIIKAKERGLPVTCGVTPHHLFLTEHDGAALGSFGKMKPPLASHTDVAFLWQHLNDIDIIESDHAPHTLEEKDKPAVPYGVPGLETTLPLLLTALSDGKMTIADIKRLCHDNPSQIFGITQSLDTKIEIDLGASYVLTGKRLFTKCKWTPFEGWKVKGKIQKVFLDGQLVFANGKLLVKPGSGKIITRSSH